ncbi:DNA cytosine methyltransferase [Mucilaginibacter rubeus]|uniref:Cytosine-specific methyltransferase n=1 Tax=Mucilaginibacter rubeus TaxID=2027860 RepID=A0A5C1I382_9SPHI|nr:DNA cytosine methyltransferase [Mucilaginibacter rubeus]QEM12214.1 DNA cytosine methyltransferase [Mucilaginibacter rubeus]
MKQKDKIIARKPRKRDVAVIDVFCGVGGLTRGMQDVGLNVVAGIDYDQTCDYAFEYNNNSKFLHRDVTTINAKEVSKLYPKHSLKILVGCAPCQPFSQVPGEREDKEGKWRLLYSFAEMIEKVKPSIISMENVPQLMSHKDGVVIKDFVNKLESLGYKVTTYKVNAAHYGVPQRRYRLILFASKFGKIELVPKMFEKEQFPTVADAIKHLPPVEDGEIHPQDTLHRARKLSPKNKARIMATSEGGNWTEWPEHLLEGLTCRESSIGKTFTSAYGRMAWDKPSPTLTTHCVGLSNGCYGHPVQNRAITLREAALLQSFPANYKFVKEDEDLNISVLARQIGNAVPPKLGESIGLSILNHLEQHNIDGRKA